MSQCKLFVLGRNYDSHNLECVDNDVNTVIATFQSYNYTAYHSKANEKTELIKELDKITSDLTKEDIFIFYYAGHAKSDENYYLYIDSNKVDFDSYIYKTIKENKSIKNVLFVIDACMSARALKSIQIIKDDFCAIVSSPYDQKSYEMKTEDIEHFDTEVPLGFFTHFFTKAIDSLFLESEKIDIQSLGKFVENEINKYNNSFSEKIPLPQIQANKNNFSIPNNNLDYEKIQKLKQCYFSYPEYIEVFQKEGFFINFLTSLHEGFEHKIIQIERDIKNHEFNIDKQSLRIQLGNLLFKIQEMFLNCSLDVSVHIKLNYIIDGITYLKAIARVPSNYENYEELGTRSNDEPFVLNYEQTISEIRKIAGNNNVKVNSAYNQAFLNDYWICNNLISAEKKDYFYSNSNDYKKYYNSLAVFSIHNKEEKVLLEDIKGLLIIDSIETCYFNKQFIKQLGGYLSHRINRLLSLHEFSTLFE